MMSSSFNLQEYPLPAVILQQILAKMDKEALVKLYLTSKLGQAMVEQLQGAKFERYVTAKREEIEIMKVLKLKVTPTREGTVKMLRRKQYDVELFEEFMEETPECRDFIAPGLEEARRAAVLVQKLLDNWEILH